MIKQEIQGQAFYICEHDNLVTENIDEHKCPHALIGECNNCVSVINDELDILLRTVDLDRYGNCSACGSHQVTTRRAKWTHAEVTAADRSPRVVVILRGEEEWSFPWSSCVHSAKALVRTMHRMLHTA